MRLVLHRRVRSDVDEITDYYERAEHPELAEDFYRELRGFLSRGRLGVGTTYLKRAARPGRGVRSRRMLYR